jgi:tRNA A-37 threonylcarbamoyl transferase component Bud32
MTQPVARLAGRYALLAELGKGGMGVVYRARDEATNRDVALKQVRIVDAAQRSKAEALLEREYRTLVRLKHPRIIGVYDFGLAETGSYYTMELLDGEDLSRRAPVPYRDMCRYLRDVASSLALIHAHRLVHRDVSPRNIRFTGEGRAKLIDFGALAPFGPARDVVGTPACIAPEMLRCMPLDQRTDIYSLGAVAYFALTGRPPYPARAVGDLPELWATSPVPPSVLISKIPPELDRLVLSMLNHDPLARPSAASVIDQLTAIAGLETDGHDQEAQSYLLSSQFVGRDAELDRLSRRLDVLPQAKGTRVILEGPAGIGRTRLLREACVLATLKGVIVAHADALSTSEAFGVATQLGVRLLAACPDVALRAAEPHRNLLGHLSVELAERLGSPELLPLPLNHGERRASLQTALYEWFLEFVRHRPLLLGVDNVQALDDNSAAFLSALGHRAHSASLMLLLTQRSEEAVVAEGPVRALRHHGSHWKLGSLGLADCEQLVESLFGGAANSRRLASLLYDRAAGNPRQLTDSVQLLVKRRVIRYVGGAWILPLTVSSDELPGSIDELIAARLDALGTRARSIAESLSVVSKPFSLERLRLLLKDVPDDDLFAALDELVTEEILVVEGSKYRFAHGAVRDAVLAQLDEQGRREKHRLAGEAFLCASEEDTAARMDAGWHLLHAGEERRGADILADVGSAFLATLSATETTEQAAALCAALAIYDKQGRSPYEVARVLFPLLPLAYYGDYRLGLEHGERCIRLGLEITGLALAAELAPHLGSERALQVALAVAAARFSREEAQGLRYGLKEAIGRFCGVVPAVAALVSSCLDFERLERVRDLVAPLGLFPRDELPRLIHDYVICQTRQAVHDGACFSLIDDLMERFRRPRTKESLGEGRWKAIYGGSFFMVGILAALGFGSGALDRARELDDLEVRAWAISADQIRLLYHVMRGESVDAQHYTERVEVFAVQGSSTWQSEMFYPVILFIAHVLSEDTVAVRRVAEQLGRLSADLGTFRVHADAAHAAYLMLRGDVRTSLSHFERIVRELPLHRRLNSQAVRGCYAKALNLAGQHAEAKAVALEVIASATPSDSALVALYLPAKIELALADAGLGKHGAAVEQLETLLAEHGHQDQPLFVGLLHRARAEVAVLMSDRAGYEVHSTAMADRFHRTHNPALVAQGDRLTARAARAGLTELRLAPLQEASTASNSTHSSVTTATTYSTYSGSSSRKRD